MPRDIKLHTQPKTRNLFRALLFYSSKQGDTILDPFLGSGTTELIGKKD